MTAANVTIEDAVLFGMPKLARRRRDMAQSLRRQIAGYNAMYLLAEEHGLEYEMERMQSAAMELTTDLNILTGEAQS